MAPFLKVLAAIGALSSIFVLRQIYSTFIQFARPCTLSRYLHTKDSKDGAWALITGASDGIGASFADELCRRGFNVIVHGRNQAKLEAVKRNLDAKYPTRRIRILVADASVIGTDAIRAIERIAEELKPLNLTVLINNVGAGEGAQGFQRFLDRSLEDIMSVMAVNAGFTTMLTRALLPDLIERQPALIMNVGSVAADMGVSFLSPYSGAKAHIRTFSFALKTEMATENYDIEVLHHNVFAAATPGNQDPADAVTVTPRTSAAGALDRVGCGEYTTSGCFRHAVLYKLASSFMSEGLKGKLATAAITQKMSRL